MSKFIAVAVLAIFATLAVQNLRAEDSTDSALLERIVQELTAVAPSGKPDDASAYAAASRKLADSKLLESVSTNLIYWGGHAAEKSFDPKANKVTEFAPRVWRVEYLPEFMFSGAHTIQRAENYSILALDCQFRNAMDAGDYPYPFWHSLNKWRSYQLSKQLLLVFENNKLIAAYRSHDEDTTRSQVARNFDGIWQWSGKDHALEPHVSLYANLFSKDNPHVTTLETAYRSFERASRESNCEECHTPANKSESKKQLLLNYPNQALAARGSIIKQLESNLMPPENKENKTPAGIQDAAEKAKFLALARAFAAAADQALEFEKQRVLEK